MYLQVVNQLVLKGHGFSHAVDALYFYYSSWASAHEETAFRDSFGGLSRTGLTNAVWEGSRFPSGAKALWL